MLFILCVLNYHFHIQFLNYKKSMALQENSAYLTTKNSKALN